MNLLSPLLIFFGIFAVAMAVLQSFIAGRFFEASELHDSRQIRARSETAGWSAVFLAGASCVLLLTAGAVL